jgi:hypothetical protein
MLRHMIKVAGFLALAALGICEAQTTPADGKAELQTIRTVFIKGNSETADALRDKMTTYSCVQPSINEKKADAVMDVDEAARRSNTVLEGNRNKVASSITITMPNGDQVWSKTKLGSEGFVHSGAGIAVVEILRSLAKDACPGWVLRNEGHDGTPFHKDYVRP